MVNGGTTCLIRLHLAGMSSLPFDHDGRTGPHGRNIPHDANSRRTTMVYRHGVAAVDHGYENGRLCHPRLARPYRKRSRAASNLLLRLQSSAGGATSTQRRGPRPPRRTTTSPGAAATRTQTHLRQRLRGRDPQLLTSATGWLKCRITRPENPDLTSSVSTCTTPRERARLAVRARTASIGRLRRLASTVSGRLIRSTAMDENGSRHAANGAYLRCV